MPAASQLRLDGSKRGTKTYLCHEKKATATGAPLNPYHTHFVFVDNGKAAPAAWGGEIGLRANLESTYTSLKGVPMVLLVAQGGPGTLNTVLQVAALNQAVLIVKDSGGAADAVADYLATGKTDDPKFQAEKLQEQLVKHKLMAAGEVERRRERKAEARKRQQAAEGNGKKARVGAIHTWKNSHLGTDAELHGARVR